MSNPALRIFHLKSPNKVYPSEDDDVITSPYNSMLAMRQLTDYANSVMPVDNSSLAEITNRVKAASNNSRHRITETANAGSEKKTSWGEMNSLVAQVSKYLICIDKLNVESNRYDIFFLPEHFCSFINALNQTLLIS